jgi:ubiquinone/menaquinone biosynthesis C-methylase UbiE
MEEYLYDDNWVSVKQSQILQLLLQRINKQNKIIEAGCGVGQWVIFLKDLGYDIIGVDFSENLISSLKKKYPNYSFHVDDVTNFSYPDDSFSCILSWGVVEHFEVGPQKALNEAYRILKTGGMMFITVPCQNHLYRILYPIYKIKTSIVTSSLLRRLLKKKPFHYEFFQYDFRRSTFKSFLQKTGFTVIETVPISYEFGFALEMKKNLSLDFYKNGANKKWNGLTRTGDFLSTSLNRFSKWLTPHMMLFIVKK